MPTYQSILKSEYQQRHNRNTSYSMRSFARDLGLSQSFLSQIFNEKRKLSDEAGVMIAEKLKLKGTKKRLFANLVRLEQISNPEGKRLLKVEIEKLLNRQANFKPLDEDNFKAIADWHYFAILELTALDNFRSDLPWISRKMKLPLIEVKVAVERLMRMGLLQKIEGRLVKTEKNYIFENVSSAAIRKHHRDTLALARSALLEQEMAHREFFTVVFPMDPLKINEVKRRIREFSEELTADMQETKPKSVYKLAVQFFRLDQENVS